MESAMNLLGDGLRVCVLLRGKKLSDAPDESDTLYQLGKSHGGKMDSVGFMLEPNQIPTSQACSEDPLFVFSRAATQPPLPNSPYFYVDALLTVALSSAVSSALYELAVKVVAANMVGTDKSFSGIHLLCTVGCYQEACSQLQDAGCWADAVTLAASHLQGSDYARVLQRWADHVLYNEHNIWKALILYVSAGALHKALTVLRDSHEPDTAAMFLLACHEIKAKILSKRSADGRVAALNLDNCQGDAKSLDLPDDLNQV